MISTARTAAPARSCAAGRGTAAQSGVRWSGSIRATRADGSRADIANQSGHPSLVGDVGGINARFALGTSPDGELREVRRLACAGRRDLAGLIREYLELVGDRHPVRVPAASCRRTGHWTRCGCMTGFDDLELKLVSASRSVSLTLAEREAGCT
jgi:hypothetical protein